MPRFLPAQVLLARAGSGEDPADLVTPPFDELAEAIRQERAARHRHNFVRFESGRQLPGDAPGLDPATRGVEAFREARAAGRIETGGSAYYLMEIEERGAALRGFVGMLELVEKNRPLAFEVTADSEITDRLRQLETLKLQTAPIAVGFKADRNIGDRIERIMKEVAATPPLSEIHTHDQAMIRIWRVKGRNDEIEPLLSKRSSILLDGTARYEAALRLARRRQEADRSPSPFAAYRFTLAWMVDLSDQPVAFLARHRALRAGALSGITGADLLVKLEDDFEIERYRFKTPGAKEAEVVNLLDEMEFIGRLNHAYGFYIGDRAIYLMHLRDADAYERLLDVPHSRRWKRLDISILHALVIEKLFGLGWDAPEELEKFAAPIEARRAVSLVDDGFADAVFLLNNPYPTHLFEIAEANELIPPRTVVLARRPRVGPIMAEFQAGAMVGDGGAKQPGGKRGRR